ncbi:MAG: methylene-tetrahydromethanopterin dehydrogenase N-terminal domain-containing protein [Methanobacteriota archaeon]
MKKILVYVTPDKKSSFFDIVVAYDSQVDVVVPYSLIDEDEVSDIIHNCVFTRHPKNLKNTAVFFGGRDPKASKKLFDAARTVLEDLPENLSVSICLEPKGASTTASACVGKIREALEGKLSGAKSLVLAGTGPVGQRIALLLAKEGSLVSISSRSKNRAASVCSTLSEDYGFDVEGIEINGGDSLAYALKECDVVVSCGSKGVELLPKSVWSGNGSIKVFADVNAVPPYGIEGIEPKDDCVEREGRLFIGPLAIGSLKMKIHRRMVEKLFESNRQVLDIFEIYSLSE